MKTCSRCGSVLTKAQIENERQTSRWAFVTMLVIFLCMTVWMTFSDAPAESGSLVAKLRELFGVVR